MTTAGLEVANGSNGSWFSVVSQSANGISSDSFKSSGFKLNSLAGVKKAEFSASELGSKMVSWFSCSSISSWLQDSKVVSGLGSRFSGFDSLTFDGS